MPPMRSITLGVVLGLSTLVLCGSAASAKDYTVQFKTVPQNYEIRKAGTALKALKTNAEWKQFNIPEGLAELTISAEGYVPYPLLMDSKKTRSLELKLEKSDSKLSLIGELPSGSQPKSIVFTPDGTHALSAELDGGGIDVYTVDPLVRERTVDIPPAGRGKSGYVEFAMLPWLDEVWVSQMTTGQVHILKLSDLSYKSSFSVGGTWPKVIVIHPDRKIAFVSNWVSLNVSVIDIETHKVLKLLKCTGTPRGMAVSPDKAFLYVTNYDSGGIDKFRLSDYARVKTLDMGRGAARHLVLDPKGETLYMSDMLRGDVTFIRLSDDTIQARIPVGPKLNSMGISPDGRFLFISSRGNNNPVTYLEKGPDFGTLSVIDTVSKKKVDWVWGRNQPTGLAVHPSKHIVAFTDFLDDNIEFYDFSELYGTDTAAAEPLSPPSR